MAAEVPEARLMAVTVPVDPETVGVCAPVKPVTLPLDVAVAAAVPEAVMNFFGLPEALEDAGDVAFTRILAVTSPLAFETAEAAPLVKGMALPLVEETASHRPDAATTCLPSAPLAEEEPTAVPCAGKFCGAPITPAVPWAADTAWATPVDRRRAVTVPEAVDVAEFLPLAVVRLVGSPLAVERASALPLA